MFIYFIIMKYYLFIVENYKIKISRKKNTNSRISVGIMAHHRYVYTFTYMLFIEADIAR